MKKKSYVFLCIFLSIGFFCLGKYSHRRCYCTGDILGHSLTIKQGMSMAELQAALKCSKAYEEVLCVPQVSGPYDVALVTPDRLLNDKMVEYACIRLRNKITGNLYDVYMAGNVNGERDRNEIVKIFQITDKANAPQGEMGIYKIYDKFDLSS